MSAEALNGPIAQPAPAPVNFEQRETSSTENPSGLNGPGSAPAPPKPMVSEPQTESKPSDITKEAPSEPKQIETPGVPKAPEAERKQEGEAAGAQESKKHAGDAGTATKEPSAKKQKVEEEKPAEEPAPASNGVKKRGPGRPKKGEGKATAKKDPTPRSTEGIGSRTRSRANA